MSDPSAAPETALPVVLAVARLPPCIRAFAGQRLLSPVPECR
jgi:hypothetical protein